jgi:hypothetical protein
MTDTATTDTNLGRVAFEASWRLQDREMLDTLWNNKTDYQRDGWRLAAAAVRAEVEREWIPGNSPECGKNDWCPYTDSTKTCFNCGHIWKHPCRVPHHARYEHGRRDALAESRVVVKAIQAEVERELVGRYQPLVDALAVWRIAVMEEAHGKRSALSLLNAELSVVNALAALKGQDAPDDRDDDAS